MRSYKTCTLNRSCKSCPPSLSFSLPPNSSGATCLSLKVTSYSVATYKVLCPVLGFCPQPLASTPPTRILQSPHSKSVTQANPFPRDWGEGRKGPCGDLPPTHTACPPHKARSTMFHLVQEALQLTQAITSCSSQVTPLATGQLLPRFPVRHWRCFFGVHMCVSWGSLKLGAY